jgi:processive 1,2-diacylglycerol beta-glucosyltransferase
MPPKRIILRYISEVSGHHSATMAIEKAVRAIAPNSEILNINAFNYTNPVSEKVVNRLYMGLIKRTPQIWDYLYDNPAVVKKIQNIKNAIHRMNSPKLKKLFDKFKPDVVACSQAFPCGMVADYKKIYSSSLPLIAVLTDYVPHSYWIYDNVDNYVTPSEEVANRLNAKGVDHQKIRPLGIPFDLKFNDHIDREAVVARYGLDPSLPVILMMGGGQGLGPIKSIVRSFEKIDLPLQEIVVAGSNRKLYNAMRRKTKRLHKKIVLLGFADNIHELMSISDMIITKPGGITTAEALAKKLPMLIVKPIPGQEASNTVYLTERKAAIEVSDLREINLIVDDLLRHREKLAHMREQAAAISKPGASIDIARLLLGLA